MKLNDYGAFFYFFCNNVKSSENHALYKKSPVLKNIEPLSSGSIRYGGHTIIRWFFPKNCVLRVLLNPIVQRKPRRKHKKRAGRKHKNRWEGPVSQYDIDLSSRVMPICYEEFLMLMLKEVVEDARKDPSVLGEFGTGAIKHLEDPIKRGSYANG